MRTETKLVFKCPTCAFNKFTCDGKTSRKYRCANPAPGGNFNHICGFSFEEDEMYTVTHVETKTAFDSAHELDLFYRQTLK